MELVETCGNPVSVDLDHLTAAQSCSDFPHPLDVAVVCFFAVVHHSCLSLSLSHTQQHSHIEVAEPKLKIHCYTFNADYLAKRDHDDWMKQKTINSTAPTINTAI